MKTTTPSPSQPPTPEICFLRVRTAHEKLLLISSLVQEHFHKGQTTLLHVPSQAAAEYLSASLWKVPTEGFIPHQIIQGKSSFPVVITTLSGNLNNADILFHLCPAACKQVTSFQLIYDLQDETAGTKLHLSQQRRAEYERRSYKFYTDRS